MTRLAAVFLTSILAACALGAPVRPLGLIDAEYRAALSRGRRGDAPVAVRVYRGLLAQSLFSRCRMIPSDSEAFVIRARSCGGSWAAVLGAARLYLEVAAGPRFLQPVAGRRLRWLDAPAPGSCSP